MNSVWLLLAALLVLLKACMVQAWGYAGHQLTAAIAQHNLHDGVRERVLSLISKGNMSSVATWADEIKRDAKYRYTSVLHYVNPHDSEPDQCSFDYRADCGNGKCVVGAILNFTEHLDPKNGYSKAVQTEALKFLIHFIADMHQPLHVSGRDKGGNLAEARFFGVKTNLHSVWDSSILMKRIADGFSGNYYKFLRYLLDSETHEQIRQSIHTENMRECFAKVDTATPTSPIAKWFKSMGIMDKVIGQLLPQRIKIHPTASTFKFDNGRPVCPEQWAKETNKLNCQLVWSGFDENKGVLGEKYYQEGYVATEKLLIQGGLRLAAVLNHLFSQ